MLKVAILGAGAIADSHIQAYLRFPDLCRIGAVVDLYPDKAAEKVAKHHLSARIYARLEDLLAKEAVDLASVCLPPFEHAAAAVALLVAGAHVVVEKPMATCLQECDQILEAARASGRRVSVVAQNRFKTPMMKLKRLLESGVLGRILHAQVNSLWWRGGNYYDLWWRGTWEKEGGGCTMNHAVHHIDLFQWMMGMPRELHAVTANLAHENSEVEDFAAATLRYEDGRLGQITASLVHPAEEQQLLFQGERASVSIPWKVQAVRQRPNGFPEDDLEGAAEIQARYDQFPSVALEGHDGQIANVLAAIDGRETLLVDGREGRLTLEIISAIYQSSHLGQTVILPMRPQDPFYTREGILKHARRFHQKTGNVDNFASNKITLGRNYGQ
jgi:predicted dehydrogenase